MTVHRLPTSDGGSLHVVDTGDERAKPIVFVHGITLSSAIWDKQRRDLADRYRIVTPDLRGHGRSTAGRGAFGLDAMAGDIVTVLEDLDLRDAIVVGHSMGGIVLGHAVGTRRDVFEARVDGVVFLSSSPGAAVPPVARRATSALGRLGARVGWRLPWYGFPANRVTRAVLRTAFGASPDDADIEATRALVAATDRATSWQCGFAMMEHDARVTLRDANVRAIVVVGSRDRFTTPARARRLASLLPGARLEIVDGAGHQLMLERPDALAALVDEFAQVPAC